MDLNQTMTWIWWWRLRKKDVFHPHFFSSYYYFKFATISTLKPFKVMINKGCLIIQIIIIYLGHYAILIRNWHTHDGGFLRFSPNPLKANFIVMTEPKSWREERGGGEGGLKTLFERWWGEQCTPPPTPQAWMPPPPLSISLNAPLPPPPPLEWFVPWTSVHKF